jgi:hypothetical protein
VRHCDSSRAATSENALNKYWNRVYPIVDRVPSCPFSLDRCQIGLMIPVIRIEYVVRGMCTSQTGDSFEGPSHRQSEEDLVPSMSVPRKAEWWRTGDESCGSEDRSLIVARLNSLHNVGQIQIGEYVRLPTWHLQVSGRCRTCLKPCGTVQRLQKARRLSPTSGVVQEYTFCAYHQLVPTCTPALTKPTSA